jgi:hypothetical protein
MGVSFEFILLCLCWITALVTLLIFLETCFALLPHNRFIAGRASGAYGVISIFVPMRAPAAVLERTIRSIFNQSYPFIELFLIYPERDKSLGKLARGFRDTRSHIPVRLVETPFPIVSQYDCARSLERVQGNARGRWLVTLDSDVSLDRFAVETALEFAGSNNIAALALRSGLRCRTLWEKWVAPAREHFLQAVRVARRRYQIPSSKEFDNSFLLVNREAFQAVNGINRMPGILNDAGWSLWSYPAEGFRVFEADGARWIWRDVELRKESVPARILIGSSVFALIDAVGLIYGLMNVTSGFYGASVLAFSAVTYSLMATSYFLFARRFHGAIWCAPLWLIPHLVAAALTAFHPLQRPLGDSSVTQVTEIVEDGKSRSDSGSS